MNKYKICIILSLLLGSSCAEVDLVDRIVPSTDAFVAIVNDKGLDLLNPALEGHIDLQKARIYSLVKGKEKLYMVDNPGSPYGISPANIGASLNYYTTNLSLASEIENDRSTDIIKWNETMTDTISCELERRVITKLYVNGKLMYEGVKDEIRLITLIK